MERSLTARLDEILLDSRDRAGDSSLVAASWLGFNPDVALMVLPHSRPHRIAELSVADDLGCSVILHGHLRQQAGIQVDLLRGPDHFDADASPAPQLFHLKLLSGVLAFDPIRQRRLLPTLAIQRLVEPSVLQLFGK